MAVPDCKAIAPILWTQTVHLQDQKLFAICCPFADGRCSAGRHWGKSHMHLVVGESVASLNDSKQKQLHSLIEFTGHKWEYCMGKNGNTLGWTIRPWTLQMFQPQDKYVFSKHFWNFPSFYPPLSNRDNLRVVLSAHETFPESNFKCYHATKHLLFSFGISPCYCLVFCL